MAKKGERKGYKSMNVYLKEDEYEYAKRKGKGYVRSLVRRDMRRLIEDALKE